MASTGSEAAGVPGGVSSAVAARLRVRRRNRPLMGGGARRSKRPEVEYRVGSRARRAPPAGRARPRPRARPCGRPRTARRGARPSTRGSAACEVRRAAPRATRRGPTARSSAPSMPSQRDRVDADRRAERGHAAGERLDHRRARSPRACEGTSTALAALIQYGTSSGATRAQRQQRHVAGRLARAVEALQRPRGVVREQQVRARRGPGRGARAPRRAGSARKRSRSIPTGSTATRRVVARAREVAR